MYSFLYLSFSINIVFSYVDLSSTIMYIVFVDFNKSSFQKKKKKVTTDDELDILRDMHNIQFPREPKQSF